MNKEKLKQAVLQKLASIGNVALAGVPIGMIGGLTANNDNLGEQLGYGAVGGALGGVGGAALGAIPGALMRKPGVGLAGAGLGALTGAALTGKNLAHRAQQKRNELLQKRAVAASTLIGAGIGGLTAPEGSKADGLVYGGAAGMLGGSLGSYLGHKLTQKASNPKLRVGALLAGGLGGTILGGMAGGQAASEDQDALRKRIKQDLLAEQRG